MILHVVDTDGKSFYVTEMNAVDAATGQARVIFVDPAQGKTFVHLYAEFFRVVTTVDEDGNESEVPQYQVVGVVDEVPVSTALTESADRVSKKKKEEKVEVKTRPVRSREVSTAEAMPQGANSPKYGAEARSQEASEDSGAPAFSVSFDDESELKADAAH